MIPDKNQFFVLFGSFICWHFQKAKARFIVDYPLFGVCLLSLNAYLLVTHCWHEDYLTIVRPSRSVTLLMIYHLIFYLTDGDVTVA